MPIEYKSYGCKHKCGYRHNTNKRRIERHESECFYAPEHRTCLTCDHEISTTEWSDEGQPKHIRSCCIPFMEEKLEREQLSLKTTKGWIKPIFHCPYHSSQSDDEKQLIENFWDSND